MKRNQDDDQNKKYDIYIDQVAEKFFPFNTSEEKKEKNESDQKYQA